MAGRMIVQHTYNSKTGLAQDAIVNTFYFDAAGADVVNATTAQQVTAFVLGFYDSTVLTFGAVRTWIAEAALATLRHTVKVYDYNHATPRVPVYTVSTANGNANNSNGSLPSEVAVALSYKGLLVSGQNAARNKGRIYIGPLAPTCVAADANGQGRVDAAFRTVLVQSANKMHDDAGAAGWNWMQRSSVIEAQLGGDFALGAINEVWVDDAFDIQRRRGVDPSTRTSLVVQ